MAKSKKKTKRNDRNFKIGPMTKLEQVPLPQDAMDLGYVGAYENNKYGVFIKPSESEGINGFSMSDDSGNQVPMQIMHLVIVRLDRKSERKWSDIQDIKSELMGPMVEAVELYPTELRRMHGIVDHQTHLWCMYPGATFPLGLMPKAIEFMQERAEELTVSKEDIQVFVVKGDMMEVFASQEEANASYENNGQPAPDGKISMIGEVATEAEGAAWSEDAKKKVENVLSKSRQMNELIADGDKGLPAHEDDADDDINTDSDKVPEDVVNVESLIDAQAAIEGKINSDNAEKVAEAKNSKEAQSDLDDIRKDVIASISEKE